MSSMEALKKPQTSYFLWLNANREKITQLAGSKNPTQTAAKASEMWKAASAAEKAPHEKEAKRQKDAYDAFVATPEGQKALEEKKSGKKEEKQAKQQKEDEKSKAKEEKQQAREKRDCKAAAKAVEKDERLKKPLTSYFAWLNDNRARITELLGKGGAQVASKGSEMWKKLSEKEKKPYEDRAQKEKAAYEAYIQTAEGAAALKAYKEATAAVAYKEKIVEVAEGEPAAKKAKTARAGA